MSVNKVGAVGGSSNNADGSVNARIESGINDAGDAVYFDSIQKSNTLNNLRGSQGTIMVYPESLYNDPQHGQLVHFDIFYKKSPKMEDVTKKTKDIFGFGSKAENISQSLESATEESQFLTNGSASGQQDALLGSIRDAFGSFGIGDPNTSTEDVPKDLVIEDTRLGKATEESLDKVTLYMPTGLKNSDSINYAEADLGLLKGVIEGNISSLVPGIASQVAGFVDGVAEITSTELNASQAISAVTGSVRNPRKEQLFESVGFRTFDFTFNFYPKSMKESHDVATIIKLFRFHAHPEIVPNQAFYSFPSEFQITYIDLSYPSNSPYINQQTGQEGVIAKENMWLNKLRRCVLSSVSVEYFGDKISTFADGAPTQIQMSLSFTEMETISRNHVKAGY